MPAFLCQGKVRWAIATTHPTSYLPCSLAPRQNPTPALQTVANEQFPAPLSVRIENEGSVTITLKGKID